MKHYTYEKLTPSEKTVLTRSSSGDFSDVMPLVRSIFDEVCTEKDEALRRFTKKFDGAEVVDIRVAETEFACARSMVDSKTKTALTEAAEAIEAFHAPQVPQMITVETKPGVLCRREWRPIERAGLYIPGGSAPLFSTVLMLGIPARLAGCSDVVLCTPPSKDGSVSPEILVAANIVGIKNVFKVGGAQAIAAMAVGTESISQVDKIFGPGNRYVAVAKSIVSQPPYNIAIDLMAGPSELLIVADDTANPRWVAADLLSQAEHGTDSHVVLVTTSTALVNTVQRELSIQLAKLPRQHLIRQTLDKSCMIVVRNLDEALEFSNLYAPEHLILAVQDADSITVKVTNAGSVFLGSLSSVVFGDYASGTNHTLPTGGTACSTGGITVESFMKPIFFQTITPQGLTTLADTVKTLARAEHLEAHAMAVVEREASQ